MTINLDGTTDTFGGQTLDNRVVHKGNLVDLDGE